MKRFLLCLLCIVMVFSVTACKKANEADLEPPLEKIEPPVVTNPEDMVWGQEDEFITKEFDRGNGKVYVKSTVHYNHLGYRNTFQTDMFTVETGEDYEKFSVNNTDGYFTVKAKAFGNLDETLAEVKKNNKIETEASIWIGETEGYAYLLKDTDQHTEIFVLEKNRIVYTITVVQPTEDPDEVYKQAIDDAIFSIEFK